MSGTPGCVSTQSGCSRYSWLSRLIISGSIQSPNSMLRLIQACAMGDSPAGNLSGSTCQSPRALRSSVRPTNQPSSRTNRSIPSADACSMSSMVAAALTSKYSASQVFNWTGLGLLDTAPESLSVLRIRLCHCCVSALNPSLLWQRKISGLS